MRYAKVTMGVELEATNVARETGTLLSTKSVRGSVSDDGSLREPTFVLDGQTIVPSKTRRRVPDPDGVLRTQVTGTVPFGFSLSNARRFGFEYVTDPTPYTDLVAWSRTTVQSVLGKIPPDPRASIHVHIDVANLHWTAVQNMIAYSYALEAILFRLACGGTVHRGRALEGNGVINDYRFCRPLSSPICYRDARGQEVPLLDIREVVGAKTPTDFYAAWGRLDLYLGAVPHYCPHRLMFANLASVARRGTLEFRLFDARYTLLPLFLDLVYGLYVRGVESTPPDDALVAQLGDRPRLENEELLVQIANSYFMTDVSPAWGRKWPRGVQDPSRVHHYDRWSNDITGRPIDENSVPSVLYRRGR